MKGKSRANCWSLAIMGANELGAAAEGKKLDTFDIGRQRRSAQDMRTFSLDGPGHEIQSAVRQPAATRVHHNSVLPVTSTWILHTSRSCPPRVSERTVATPGFFNGARPNGDPLDS